MNSFKNMKPSQNADSIYYADLFNINNKIWMITGNGKSNAALIATNQEETADIARDSVALIREDNTLYGHWDPGAFSTDLQLQKDLYELHKLDFIAYCLNEMETIEFYKKAPLSIVEIDNYGLALLLKDSRYPAFFAPRFFDGDTYNWLINPKRRFDRFIEITTGLKNTLFLAVPWMAQIRGKAILYQNF